ncbi:MAG: T9SS type A sorting domain-containing protein, partial [bacterium]|nr:T9SS type A sorting domain-containing protein [bacterium]
FVSLKVYDLLGKEVLTSVNENKQPGKYSVTFAGSNFASGIYYYQLQAGDFNSVRKMILIK